MVKYVKTSPHAAYKVALDVTAEEAAELGLAVVESTPDGRPAAYGKYDDAPDGGPLGITVAQTGDTDVVAGGTVSPNADDPSSLSQKGSVLNPNDPFVHGESIHADGAAPGTANSQTDEDAAVAEAEAANEANAKKK